MKNYLTIYLQYINGNPKISINIKANHSFKVLPEKNFDKKNVLGCVSRKSDRERLKNKQ